MKIDLPLMENNIGQDDLAVLIEFLKTNPRLTQAENVRLFEEEWSKWLGVKHSVFVNSGSSANVMTIAALKYLYGEGGEILVPTLTWVSDIVSVIQAGFTPVFVDINPRNLAMDDGEIISKLTDKTRAVFLTHVQGFNGLTDRLLGVLKERGIPLIEDVCESHGATFRGRKCGSFGLASNFSFYFAHHMSTVEGGMVCTNDDNFYQALRMLRSHGMVREVTDPALKQKYADDNPELSSDFIFAMPAGNYRNSEIGAVIGRNQLKKLDVNNELRRKNFDLFLKNLDSKHYRSDFDVEGSCNYALCLVIKEKDLAFRSAVEEAMRQAGVEFRRGSSGGGNQLRQPYLAPFVAKGEYLKYPQIEHIHSFGYYIGNFPGLDEGRILALCHLLNNVKFG